MPRPTLLRHLAVYGASLQAIAAAPALARATVYMPSHVAARVLGDCPSAELDIAHDSPDDRAAPDTSHAA